MFYILTFYQSVLQLLMILPCVSYCLLSLRRCPQTILVWLSLPLFSLVVSYIPRIDYIETFLQIWPLTFRFQDFPIHLFVTWTMESRSPIVNILVTWTYNTTLFIHLSQQPSVQRMTVFPFNVYSFFPPDLT